MELVKNKVFKDGVEYTDLYARWEHNGKTYLVRVQPVFDKQWRLLLATAKDMD